MMRVLVLLLLVAAPALAGDYVHIPTGRVAFDRADRKYTSAEAIRSGWRPVLRASMPPGALAIAKRTGRLDKSTWLIGDGGSIEAHDQGALEAGIAEQETAAAAEALAEQAALIAQLRASLALVDEIGSGLPAGVVTAAKELLRGRLRKVEVSR